jgi:hypothetical protein
VRNRDLGFETDRIDEVAADDYRRLGPQKCA